MTQNRQRWFILAVFFLGLFFLSFMGTFWAQQQFSGGQTVTIGNASLAATESGTWTMQPGNTANTTPWLVTPNDGSGHSTPAGDASARSIHETVDNATLAATQSGAWNMGVSAGTAKIGVTYPYTGCGTTQFESGAPAGFAALVASTTTITSTTTCPLTMVVTNTGSASFTYYVTDNQATPIPVLGSAANPVTILPGERDEYTFPNGSKFNSGIKLTASATTGAYYILGVQ